MSRLLRKRISGSGLPARTERRRIGDFGFCAMTGAPPASAFRRRPGWRAKKEARRERRPRSCVNLAQLHRADLTLVVSLITATPNRVIFDGIEKIFGKRQGIQGGFRDVSLGGWRSSAATVISLSLRQLEGYSLGEGDEACAVWHPPLPCLSSPCPQPRQQTDQGWQLRGRARPTGSPDYAQSGRPTAHLPRLFSRHDCAGF
jgi:hypothetical protein